MKIIHEDTVFFEYEYLFEEDLQRDIVNHVDTVFGERCIYFDVKKKMDNTIPDGYLIYVSEDGDVNLYFVVIRLSRYDIYSHITSRLQKYMVSYNNKEKIYCTLLEEMDEDTLYKIRHLLHDTSFPDERKLIQSLIQDKLSILVITDHKAEELKKAFDKLCIKNVNIKTGEFKKFVCGNKEQYWTTVNFDIEEGFEEYRETIDDMEDEVDTIIVSADYEGFEKIFLGENCWYTVRIADYKIEKIRYVAAYIIRPYHHITHYAKVDRIVPYKDGYKILFNGDPIAIPEIPRGEDTWVMRERVRYTTYDKFMNSDTITDMFEY